jgi:hypothetical protein
VGDLRLQPRLSQLTQEDGILEYNQAMLYALGGVAFLAAWVRSRFRNIWVLGLGVVLVVVAGEEISWGQRIFGIDTPSSLAGSNVQGETNLHNLDGVHQSVRAASLVFIFGTLVVVPVLARTSAWVRDLRDRWRVPVAPLWTLPVTVAAILFMVVPRVLFDDVVFTLDEVGETFTGLAFVAYAVAWTWSTWPRVVPSPSAGPGWEIQEPLPTAPESPGRDLEAADLATSGARER